MGRSARDIAYEHLQRGIANGEYPAGSWLREEDIAVAAGVSRTPVREAIQRLSAQGLVSIERHRGAVVIGWTASDLDNIYDLRVLLECFGIRQTTERKALLDEDALLAICDECDTLLANDGPQAGQLGQLCIDFHLTLYRGMGNRQLVAMLPATLDPPFVREAFHHHTHADLSRAFAQHREILEAIRLGDADWAEGIMRAHLRAGRHSLTRMEWTRPPGEPPASPDEPGSDRATA
ncbi:DNA-binding GntR family transcriptional regulator [Amycolatopsis sulphurea]|uniref:DNA-binding GntR family transcriptional regulator n=1 Tax=Amycolatopsis sulphurea TaxID=76022 RepID=A0A2A9FEQ9_9PSEU|nr:GntR family transcriptional regulator [Amycolatopsis sulphurea]PFG49231.1 DNA-binding GntR family transcriptional regulator [Amycolatopsis sulphurea]